MSFQRSSGILLHPTSLPSRFGIGDLGQSAYEFINFLERSNQTLWQVLPLGPTGYGNSPYMSFSAIAGNPLLISPDLLAQAELLTAADLASVPDFPTEFVDYDHVSDYKNKLFKIAFGRFQQNPPSEFAQFCQQQASWLDDYALFMSLLETMPSDTWNQWEPELAQRKPSALQAKVKELHDSVTFHKFLQYAFFSQWSQLKNYANQRKIQIIGDIPIYVAHNSADVWSSPETFKLDPETLEPAWMAGVPPDYFSETGQLWGNPVYNWKHLQTTNFAWWIERFSSILQYVDIIRIDHFRGFQAFWQVPQGETTAIKGKWKLAPGEELFETLRKTLGKLPILAENLGIITKEVEELRYKFGFPGMHVLLFAFGGSSDNTHLSHYHQKSSVVYTGTHDNDTVVGWWQRANDSEKDFMRKYLGHNPSEDINWLMIRLALSSVSDLTIIPLQDVLGLDNTARMNTPGTMGSNWAWRYRSSEQLTTEISDRLSHLTCLYDRQDQPEKYEETIEITEDEDEGEETPHPKS